MTLNGEPLASTLLSMTLLFGWTQSLPPRSVPPPETTGNVSANTILDVPQGDHGFALQQLIEIGLRNEVPLGLIVPDRDLCEGNIALPDKTISVRDLLAKLEYKFPLYKAELIDGVVNLEPRDLPKEELRLLNTQIDEFASNADTHQGMGVNLWMFIRAAIAPGEGTGFAGGSYSGEERVTGMRVENLTVRQILNLIARKGHGGVWSIENLRPDWGTTSPTLPYQIFGYRDGGGALQRLSCPVGAKAGGPGLTK